MQTAESLARSRAPLAFAAVLLAALGAALPAQPDDGRRGQDPTPARRGQQAAVVQPTDTAGIVTIEFPGGSLAQRVDALRPLSKGTNILIQPEADQVVLPPLQLRQVDAFTALKAIEMLVDDRGSHTMSVQKLGGQQQDVLTVRIRERRTRETQTPPTMVRVFSLRWLTTALPHEAAAADAVLTPDTILTAIDVGLGLAGGDKPVLRYHADSGLLFVQGGPQHVDVVQQVLMSLQEDLAQRRKSGSGGTTVRSGPGPTGPSHGAAREPSKAPEDSEHPAPPAEKRK